MKHSKQISTVFVAAMFLALAAFYACSKDEPSVQTLVPEAVSMSEADHYINDRIEHFIEKIKRVKENPSLKGHEVLSVDSAIWYIDAALNFNYAGASHPYGKIHVDTSFVNMIVCESYEVTYEKVALAYDQLLGKLSTKYYAIEGEDKQFIMAKIDDMGVLPNNERNLRIITFTGTGSLMDDDFGEDEAYKYYRSANLDCYGLPASGAPIIFEAYLNNHYNPEPSNNNHYYFYGTTVTVEYLYDDYQLNSTLTNYLDYKIFAAVSSINTITSETECLEWNQDDSGIHEMQFYYDNLIELIDAWLVSGQNSANLNFAPSIVESYTESSDDQTTLYHKPIINFRKRGLCATRIDIPEL